MIQKFLALRLIAQVLGYVLNPSHNYTVAGFLLLMDIFMLGNYVLDCSTINNFPVTALSGMFITMLNSSRNLGTNQTLQLWLIGKITFPYATMIGFTYTFIVVCLWNRMNSWIENGSLMGMEAVSTEE
jgi:hypothetical protein